MPINMDLLHNYTDAVLDIIKKANAIGQSVELAVQAFHDRFFEKHEPSDSFKGSGAYERLSSEMQSAIDEKVATVEQS